MGIKVVKYKKEEWQNVADCIRSDQVPAFEIQLIFDQNKDLYEWYKNKYLINDTDRP
jgi:hypothetical protein